METTVVGEAEDLETDMDMVLAEEEGGMDSEVCMGEEGGMDTVAMDGIRQ